jgi:flagellin
VKFTISATGNKAAADIQADLTTRHIDTTAGSGAAAFQVGAGAGETESATFFNTKLEAGNGNYATLLTAINTFGGATTIANANSMISNVDTVIAGLVTQRAALGASQNSLQHTLNNLKTNSDNLSASNSRIRDVDVAQESSAMTRAQIISQSAVSVLAQANQMPQLALKLLG